MLIFIGQINAVLSNFVLRAKCQARRSNAATNMPMPLNVTFFSF